MIKKINYFLLNLIYPKPNKIIKPLKKEIKKVRFKSLIYKIFNFKNVRIYTDTIHNFAVIKKNKLIEGPSYQFRDNNFSNIINNITLKIGTPRKKIILKKTILALLSGGGANKNYFHWLFDVLPRLGVFEKKYNLKKIDFFLFPDTTQKFQKETLKLLKLDKKSLSSIKYRHIQSDQVFVTTHPYIFSKNSHKDAQKIPRWICQWLKNNFLKHSSNKYNYNKVYINRRFEKNSDKSRIIINNSEIKQFLEKLGFKSLFLEDFSFVDQISIFNNAKIIVGLHGAGFANLVFCKKNTKIVELSTKTSGFQIKNLALKNNLNYECVHGVSKGKTFVQQGAIKIPLNVLKKKLNINSTAG